MQRSWGGQGGQVGSLLVSLCVEEASLLLTGWPVSMYITSHWGSLAGPRSPMALLGSLAPAARSPGPGTPLTAAVLPLGHAWLHLTNMGCKEK